jgi:predicted MFS family arabinose efflux permease
MTDFTRSYAILYGFSSGLVGVCYLPNAAGSILGSLIGGRLSDSIYNKRVANAKNKNQDSYPEMRLGGLLFYMGIIIQSLAFIAYGWCIQEEVHFAYGLVCQFISKLLSFFPVRNYCPVTYSMNIVGLAVTVPNITINTYLVDCFRKKGASAMACNNFARYITAGIGSLVASDILRALGTGPLFTMCGGLILLASINLLVLMKYGKKWSATRVDPL